MRQLLLDFTRAPAPTFENFVHGRNAELVHALEAAARGAFGDRVIYVWGETASGKTHLLKAFAEASGAVYRQAREFDGFERCGGVVALDVIEGLSEGAQAEIFNAFIEHSFSLLVVAAQSAPRDVALRRDLATRLASGLTYRVLALTDEEKRDALAAHAKARGFKLEEDVSAYLLSHLRRDMGSLIAALDSLDRYSLETGRPITVPLLKDALQLTLSPTLESNSPTFGGGPPGRGSAP
jgi:DnaA family protein